MTEWIEDAGHVWDIGRTQTGKTTTAREAFAESSRVGIWLNYRGDDRVEGVQQWADGSHRSLRGVRQAFGRDEQRIEFLPSDPAEGIEELQSWLWQVADAVDRDLPVTVFIDEIHNIAPQSQRDELEGRDAVRRISKEGMKRNIKLWGISQDPVSFDKQSLRQREYLLCYALSHEQGRYLSDYGVDVSRVNDQPEFAGIVYHANGSVVEEGVRAQPRYA